MPTTRTPDWVDPADWRGLIVLCSGISWDGAFMSDKQLAVRLCEYAPVLFVDPPMSVLTPIKRPELRQALTEPRLSRLGPRLARLTPFSLPGISRPILRDVAIRATRAAMKRAVHTLGGDVRAVIIASLDGLFGACNESVRVLWGTDDFAAAGQLMGLSTEWLQKREVAQLQSADLIVAVSQHLADHWREMGKNALVIPNGCDSTMYAETDTAPWPADVTLPEPIAGFVGQLSERIDLRYLEAIADTGRSLLLVGPRQPTFELGRINALLQQPNVQWVGSKPFGSLPSYLRAMRVGITPYARTAFNDSSFPLKTLEYLAAGRAAISTDLPSARWLQTDLVTICSTPQEFAACTGLALDAPVDESLQATRKAFAVRHSWDSRARDFASLLGAFA
jgi:teichuronic acid biosynthesis glycosyltransferase TuaH